MHALSGDHVLRADREGAREACRHCRCNMRVGSAQEGQPGGPDHAGGADRVDPAGLRGRRRSRPYPCAQRRRDVLVGSRALRGGQGGCREALPGHDRPVLDRRAGSGSGPAQQRALPQARHGLALDRIGQFPDHRLRESHDARRGDGGQDARSSGSGRRSRSSTCPICTAPGASPTRG